MDQANLKAVLANWKTKISTSLDDPAHRRIIFQYIPLDYELFEETFEEYYGEFYFLVEITVYYDDKTEKFWFANDGVDDGNSYADEEFLTSSIYIPYEVGEINMEIRFLIGFYLDVDEDEYVETFQKCNVTVNLIETFEKNIDMEETSPFLEAPFTEYDEEIEVYSKAEYGPVLYGVDEYKKLWLIPEAGLFSYGSSGVEKLFPIQQPSDILIQNSQFDYYYCVNVLGLLAIQTTERNYAEREDTYWYSLYDMKTETLLTKKQVPRLIDLMYSAIDNEGKYLAATEMNRFNIYDCRTLTLIYSYEYRNGHYYDLGRISAVFHQSIVYITGREATVTIDLERKRHVVTRHVNDLEGSHEVHSGYHPVAGLSASVSTLLYFRMGLTQLAWRNHQTGESDCMLVPFTASGRIHVLPDGRILMYDGMVYMADVKEKSVKLIGYLPNDTHFIAPLLEERDGKYRLWARKPIPDLRLQATLADKTVRWYIDFE